jgi:hypothetical protein
MFNFVILLCCLEQFRYLGLKTGKSSWSCRCPLFPNQYLNSKPSSGRFMSLQSLTKLGSRLGAPSATQRKLVVGMVSHCSGQSSDLDQSYDSGGRLAGICRYQNIFWLPVYIPKGLWRQPRLLEHDVGPRRDILLLPASCYEKKGCDNFSVQGEQEPEMLQAA